MDKITKAVAGDADYQNLVIGNPDQQAVEAGFRTLITRMLDNLEYF